MRRLRRPARPPFACVAAALLIASPAFASFETAPVPWRPYGQPAFTEAEEQDRLVFLVLTAPWTWDHFLVPGRVFTDSTVVQALEDGWIPVLADASVRPELRRHYSIDSGLLPSFHFLDTSGRPLASFPPMGAEELVYFLDDFRRGPVLPPEEPSPPTVTLEVNRERLANRVARHLLDLHSRGERILPVPHRDLDFSDLHFFSEYGRRRMRDELQPILGANLQAVTESRLFDPVHGGVFRAAALSGADAVHHEKTLRQNAEFGAVLASWFRMKGRDDTGEAAFAVLRNLNERMRVGGETVYVGSLSADAFDPTGRDPLLEGHKYYALDEALRRETGRPWRSDDLPVGANFAVQQALVKYLRAWGDPRMVEGVHNAARKLLAESLDEDGAARSRLGAPGIGNLRDQGDAGSGLLALHGVTGDPAALAAARRLGDVLVQRFWDPETGLFSDVATDADLPARVREAPPRADWNGIALRFLSELASLTREERWSEIVEEGLDAWAGRLPADGDGTAELGRAAMRHEKPVAVCLIDSPPDSPWADRLMRLAYTLGDPLALVRWVEEDEREEIAKTFGVTFEEEPALYIAWDETGGAVRDVPTLRRDWVSGNRRVWEGRASAR